MGLGKAVAFDLEKRLVKDGEDPTRPPCVMRPLALAGIFVLALVFRLVVLHFYHWPVVTDLYYADQAALNILAGHGFTASLHAPYVAGIFRGPGYATFLAGLYAVSGHSFTAAYIANAILDSITGFLLALIATRLGGPGFGMLCGLSYALYPYSAALCSMLHQDILLTTVITFVIWVTVRAQERPERFGWWTAAGIGVAVATLIKPVVLVIGAVPFLVLLMSPLAWKRKAVCAAVLFAATGALTVPWMARNYVEFHEFPILASGDPMDAGFEILLQDMDAARDGVTVPIITNDLSISREQYFLHFVDGEALILQTRGIREKNLRILLHRWPEWLMATLSHIPRLWVTAYSRYDAGWKSYSVSILSVVSLILGLLGMLLARKRWRLFLSGYLAIVVTTAIYAPLHVEARYTLPVRPVLLLFVGVVLYRLTFVRKLSEKLSASS